MLFSTYFAFWTFLSFFFETLEHPATSYVPSSLLYKLWMSQRIKLGVFHCSTLFHCSTIPLFHCSTVMPLTSHGRTWIERPLDWSIKSWEVSSPDLFLYNWVAPKSNSVFSPQWPSFYPASHVACCAPGPYSPKTFPCSHTPTLPNFPSNLPCSENF